MNNQEKRTMLILIELTQEKALLKWLFMPFWKALTATIILIAFCLVFSRTFYMGLIMASLIPYGIYMSRKCLKRLIEISLQEL